MYDDDIKDAHNNGKNYFDTDIPKCIRDMENKGKNLKIAKNLQKSSLTVMVVFSKQQGNLSLICITEKILEIGS